MARAIVVWALMVAFCLSLICFLGAVWEDHQLCKGGCYVEEEK